MKFFSYEVLYDDKHIRELKISSDLEESTAEIDKDNHKIVFQGFTKSFTSWPPKDFVGRFLWASLENSPEKKEAAFDS